jgi:kynureninase
MKSAVRERDRSQPPVEVRNRDEADPLRAFRGRFEIPDGVVYLDGNSLGALSVDARERLDRVTRIEWGESLIRSWNDHYWINAPSESARNLPS